MTEQTEQNEGMLHLLNQKGVLIKPKTGYWRASAKLVAKDLGVQDKSLPGNMFKLGKKILLREESLNGFKKFEGRVNSYIDGVTFQFLGGVGRFLPNSKLADAVEQMHEFDDNFDTITEDFISNYDDHRQKGLTMWEEWAEKHIEDEEKKQMLIGAIRGGFLTEDQIRKKCKFDWHLYHVQAPREIQLELTDAADVEAINNARAEAAQKASEDIESSVRGFIEDVITELREGVVTLTDEVLESMQNGKNDVHQKTLNKMKNWIDKFSDLNFTNDVQLAGTLQDFRDNLLTKTAEEYRNDEFAMIKLKTGIKKLGDFARELSEADKKELISQFGAAGKRSVKVS